MFRVLKAFIYMCVSLLHLQCAPNTMFSLICNHLLFGELYMYSFGAQCWVAAMYRFVLIKSHWNLKVCFSLNNTLVSIHCSFLSVRLTQLCSHQLWFVDPLFNLVYSILCFLPILITHLMPLLLIAYLVAF